MDKTLDEACSKRVRALMDEHGVTFSAMSALLDIRSSSFSDLLTGKSPWRMPYLARVALYFGVSTDYLIFGKNDAVEDFKDLVKEKASEDIMTVNESVATYHTSSKKKPEERLGRLMSNFLQK